MFTLSVSEIFAAGGASYTTFNAHVDGAGKDVCKNTEINCNIYGKKEYVWLNGGPLAAIMPDGYYFFAVLVPGGQPDPNDGGAKNLSDDFDDYLNRTFSVFEGELSYFGDHDLDSGQNGNGHQPDGEPPYIRLYPYADTTNNGGVYTLAICSLGNDELNLSYPVDPKDCKYDAFKVKEGRLTYSFYLQGMKFHDLYADGNNDIDDPGLSGWTIIIGGTGPDGLPIYEEVYTEENGYWEYQSVDYTFTGGDKPQDVSLTVCEVLQEGWTQSFPNPGCHLVDFTPSTGFDDFLELDFGNYKPVDITACKYVDLDGDSVGETPYPDWPVSMSLSSAIVDTQPTGSNGCYTWENLTPISPTDGYYDVHEGSVAGWVALGPTYWDFGIVQLHTTYGQEEIIP